MPNSNDTKKFPPESDLDLPDQQEFVPMEDAVTTAHLSSSDITGFNSPPAHYAQSDRETIDKIRDSMTDEQFLGFCLGNSIKYRDRAPSKGAMDSDLRKAAWYEKMAAHLQGLAEDPRSNRRDFKPYQRPKSWAQEVEEESLAQSGAQESATSPAQTEIGTWAGPHPEQADFWTFKVQAEDEATTDVVDLPVHLLIRPEVYTRVELRPWPPLSREQVVELHEALHDWAESVRLDGVMPPRQRDRALYDALQNLQISTQRPTPPTTPVEEPKPAMKRNCWTCKHDYQTEDGGTLHFCHIAHRNEPVAEWVDNYVSPKIEDRGMPPQGADGCPGWSKKP